MQVALGADGQGRTGRGGRGRSACGRGSRCRWRCPRGPSHRGSRVRVMSVSEVFRSIVAMRAMMTVSLQRPERVVQGNPASETLASRPPSGETAARASPWTDAGQRKREIDTISPRFRRVAAGDMLRLLRGRRHLSRSGRRHLSRRGRRHLSCRGRRHAHAAPRPAAVWHRRRPGICSPRPTYALVKACPIRAQTPVTGRSEETNASRGDDSHPPANHMAAHRLAAHRTCAHCRLAAALQLAAGSGNPPVRRCPRRASALIYSSHGVYTDRMASCLCTQAGRRAAATQTA